MEICPRTITSIPISNSIYISHTGTAVSSNNDNGDIYMAGTTRNRRGDAKVGNPRVLLGIVQL